MNLPRRKSLHGRGFGWHLAMPIIAIVGVATIGSILLVASHAATLSGCAAYTYKITGSTNPAPSTSDGSAAVCVNYVEKILNGVYQANYSGFQGYADQFSAASPAASSFSGLLTDNGAYSAQLMNRIEAFQEFFAYGGQDLAVDGTLTAGSQTVQAVCGVAQHMPNPDSSNTWEAAAVGAAAHFGCGTITTAPTVSSRMKAPTASAPKLTCNSDGTATVTATFGAPSGPSTAVLAVTYASSSATSTSYSATTASHTAGPVTEASNKVDTGTWKATLTATATWGMKTAASSASSSACKAPASASSSSSSSSGGSGSTDNSGDGGSSFGCDPTDPTCSGGDTSSCDPTDPTCNGDSCDPTDPTCSDSSFGSDFGDSFDTCDPTDPTCNNSSGDTSGDGSDFGSTDCTDPSCDNSSGTVSNGSGSNSDTGGNANTGTNSTKTKSGSTFSRFVQTVRTILNKLF
ncbi:MAG TPA: hypothetical protein VMB52_05840 [Verrucomicrobiae bacterium]|nr:hypothetical protein [Verrucomicrobiae bacterium]